MADLKRSTSGVWFGYEFVPAGTVLPGGHKFAGHPAFVDYEVDVETAGPPPAPTPAAEELVRPPSSGAGSGRDAWVAYAETVGVEVTDDMTRDDIIDAVDAYEA